MMMQRRREAGNGTLKLRDLKEEHIRSQLAKARDFSRTKRRGQSLRGQTKRNLEIGISAALRWAVKNKLVGENVASNIAFQIGTGLRRGETCALRWSDIDLVAGTVRVQRAAVNLRGKVFIKSPKNDGSHRTEFSELL